MKEKTNCHICGWSQKVEKDSLTHCPVCNADIVNRQDETVQDSMGCAYSIKKGAMMKPGKFIMTNKRFLWLKDNGSSDDLMYAAGGLLGVFFGKAFAKNDKVYINIPLSELVSVERTTKGMETLIIKDKNNTAYQLRIGDTNVWHQIFLKVIDNNLKG